MWRRLSDGCSQIGIRRSILAEGVSRLYDPHSVIATLAIIAIVATIAIMIIIIVTIVYVHQPLQPLSGALYRGVCHTIILDFRAPLYPKIITQYTKYSFHFTIYWQTLKVIYQNTHFVD